MLSSAVHTLCFSDRTILYDLAAASRNAKSALTKERCAEGALRSRSVPSELEAFILKRSAPQMAHPAPPDAYTVSNNSKLSPRPVCLGIKSPDHIQLQPGWFRCHSHILGNFQRPAGIMTDLFDGHSGVRCTENHLTGFRVKA